MPYEEELKVWKEELSIAFPSLSLAQFTLLALYSYGMIWTRHCGQTIVVVFLGKLLGEERANIRQRLKEWNYEAAQKRGKQRRDIVVQPLFADLLRWFLRQWQQSNELVLALDVTYLKDRWMILCVSVVYGKTALPVAWKILPAEEKGKWNPCWLALLEGLRPIISPKYRVCVLTDRGLYSPNLFRAIRAYGWHPFMRIGTQGLYQHPRQTKWRPLAKLAFRGMTPYAMRVNCFKGETISAVLWVKWDAQYHEACLLVSDILPRQIGGNPYALRMWIEMGFKQLKRGGLHWEQCKTPDAARLERLLFVMVVAHFYLVRQGQSELDLVVLASDPARRLSLFTQGWLRLLARSLADLPLTETYFVPYSFPTFYPRKKTYP